MTALLVGRTWVGRVASNITHAITTLNMQLHETWLVTSLTNKRYCHSGKAAVMSSRTNSYRHHETAAVTELHNQSIIKRFIYIYTYMETNLEICRLYIVSM